MNTAGASPVPGSQRPRVLVIAGSDSSGGAGVLRDAAAIADAGGAACVAVTAVTAQGPGGVGTIHAVPTHVVAAQIEAAMAAGPLGAVKIGMLWSERTIETVARLLNALPGVPVVLDPVLAASSGRRLLRTGAEEALRALLIPRATLITPNLPEARSLTADTGGDPVALARALLTLGPGAVLLKGGHDRGAEAVDHLVWAGGARRFAAPRLAARLRGSGCALSSAVAARLARGADLATACQGAKAQVGALFAAAAAPAV